MHYDIVLCLMFGFPSSENLKILSLGRNLIKNLTGIEAVADTLEQLWISYNQIEKLKGIAVLSKLQVKTNKSSTVESIVVVAVYTCIYTCMYVGVVYVQQ